MPLTLTVPPAAEPILRDQAKQHCRIDDAHEDRLIDRLITAARRYAERITGRAFINQTWQQSFDRFPPMDRFGPGPGMRRNDFMDGEYGLGRAIMLAKAPLVSVTSLQYFDDTNTQQTWASSNYTVDAASVPGILTESYTGVVLNQWPDTFSVRNAVTVTYVAGYGTSWESVPADLIEAMLCLIGHWYINREEVASEIANFQAQSVPMMATMLLEYYRIYDERIFAFV